MPVSAGTELRITLDQSAFEQFREHGEFLIQLPNSEKNLRLVIHDEDLSAEVEAEDETIAFD